MSHMDSMLNVDPYRAANAQAAASEAVEVTPVSADSIIGTLVKNSAEEHCGRIVDVVLHEEYGTVAYFVLSYPGHFGEEYKDKHFAVPFKAFTNPGHVSHPTRYYLDVDDTFIKKAPGGFAKNALPDFADPRFITSLHEYYDGITLDVAA